MRICGVLCVCVRVCVSSCERKAVKLVAGTNNNSSCM